MRINAQLTPNCSPTCEPYLCIAIRLVGANHRYKCGESIGITCKFLLKQSFIHRSSYQIYYWFWRGFIAVLVTPDHHFAQAVLYLYHMVYLICPGRSVLSTRTLVAAVSSHARIQTASFACSIAGITNKEYISTYCSTTAVVWLCICAKGLIQVKATFIIVVFIYIYIH